MPVTSKIQDDIDQPVLSNVHQWLLVCVATMCGFIAAYNIGKVAASIPLIREEFSTTLSGSGALASSYSVIAMLSALLFGVLVSRVGPWRAGAVGLCLLALGGALGAIATNFPLLLMSRVLEGFGFVSIAVSMPAFIGRICSGENRPFAMGVWGTFVPGGVAISLLVSPFILQAGGWRSLWWYGSAVAVAGLLMVLLLLRPAHQRVADKAVTRVPGLSSVFTRGPLILSACFALYSLTFVGLTTFLPTYWTEVHPVNLDTTTRLAAIVVIMNILGNLTGGWLNSRGVAMRRILVWALAGAGGCACVVYVEFVPLTGQLLAAGCSVFLGGMLPATLFASVADYSPTPAHNGLILGLFFQGAGAGQVLGPIMLGAIVDRFQSWYAAPWFFISAIIVAMVLLHYLPRKHSSQVD